MATSQSGITDGIAVELNDSPVVAKGPADDRLASHDEESAAFSARLKNESK